MKIYKLPLLSDTSGKREFCLGCEDLNTQAVYILYGHIAPGEEAREVSPLPGHEAILYLVKGEVTVTYGDDVFNISHGEAFHIKERDSVKLENQSDKESIYVTAGGATGAGRKD